VGNQHRMTTRSWSGLAMSKVKLPRHVHCVTSRGREYFYYQEGRGTPSAGERISLPNDPQTPEFWNAVRQAQGAIGPTPTDTVNALIVAFELSWPTRQRKLSKATEDQYRRHLQVARKAWGDRPREMCDLATWTRLFAKSVEIDRVRQTTSSRLSEPWWLGRMVRSICCHMTPRKASRVFPKGRGIGLGLWSNSNMPTRISRG